MATRYFGWDIGGAHLKIAQLDEFGAVVNLQQIACPLWRGVNELIGACESVTFDIAERNAVHAVTMTGELCDVFEDRIAGVQQIIGLLGSLLNDRAEIWIYGGGDGWLKPTEVDECHVPSVASANWLALATLVEELVNDCILLDVGSTTTDVVRIVNGEARFTGRDDESRLASEELVYTGVVRTPVIAVCRAVPYRGRWQNLAAEYFATMGDVYRLLGQIDHRYDLMPTADGRGKDRLSSARRLARMLGCDYESSDLSEICQVAAFIARTQHELIRNAIHLAMSRVPLFKKNPQIIGAGVGRFLAKRLSRSLDIGYRPFDSLIESDPKLAEGIAVAAPAVAVAKLAWKAS